MHLYLGAQWINSSKSNRYCDFNTKVFIRIQQPIQHKKDNMKAGHCLNLSRAWKAFPYFLMKFSDKNKLGITHVERNSIKANSQSTKYKLGSLVSRISLSNLNLPKGTNFNRVFAFKVEYMQLSYRNLKNSNLKN